MGLGCYLCRDGQRPSAWLVYYSLASPKWPPTRVPKSAALTMDAASSPDSSSIQSSSPGMEGGVQSTKFRGGSITQKSWTVQTVTLQSTSEGIFPSCMSKSLSHDAQSCSRRKSPQLHHIFTINSRKCGLSKVIQGKLSQCQTVGNPTEILNPRKTMQAHLYHILEETWFPRIPDLAHNLTLT